MSRPAEGRPRRVLVVDDDASLRRLFEYNLTKWGYEAEVVDCGEQMDRALSRSRLDVVLLDVRLPDGDGIDFLPRIRDAYPQTQVIMVTAHGNVDMAMDAVRVGAFDFLTKPVDLDRLEVAVRNCVALVSTQEECAAARETADRRTSLGALIGSSQAMQAVYEIIENVAASDCSVLIVGETGTGKELVAEEIHARSQRGHRDLVAVNCAAIPAELLESEMFGHERGSFTGAHQQKIGCAERADRSTLFLDELGEMNLQLQAKMLRFLQSFELTRVGGARSIKVDVRVISATNRSPQELVRQGLLREDLLYRVNVVKVHLPPLRERRPDIPLLAETFLRKASNDSGKAFEQIDGKALRTLAGYDWPGNVRQLQNVIHEIVVLSSGSTVTAEMLPAEIVEAVQDGARFKRDDRPAASHVRIAPMWQVEKEHMRRALNACNGKVTEAAELLEVSKATLYRKIKELGLKSVS